MAPTLQLQQKQLPGAVGSDAAGAGAAAGAAEGVVSESMSSGAQASFSGVTWVQTVSGDDYL